MRSKRRGQKKRETRGKETGPKHLLKVFEGGPKEPKKGNFCFGEGGGKTKKKFRCGGNDLKNLKKKDMGGHRRPRGKTLVHSKRGAKGGKGNMKRANVPIERNAGPRRIMREKIN